METKKNPKLALVKTHSTVKQNKKRNIALNELDSVIASLGDLQHLEHDPALLLHLMNLVENLSNIKLSGEDKKSLVVEKFVSLFPVSNNDRDKEKIGKLIDFLCSQGMVKVISTATVVGTSICSYLIKKALN